MASLRVWVVVIAVGVLVACARRVPLYAAPVGLPGNVRVRVYEVQARGDRIYVKSLVSNDGSERIIVDRDAWALRLTNGEVLSRSRGLTTTHAPYVIEPGGSRDIFVDFKKDGVKLAPLADGSTLFVDGVAFGNDPTPRRLGEIPIRAQPYPSESMAQTESPASIQPPPPVPATSPSIAAAPVAPAASAARIPTSTVEPPPGWSLGTCFAASPDGIVVTAAHVVESADQIWVRFEHQDRLRAQLLKKSLQADLAVLKVDVATPNFLPVVSSRTAASGVRVFTFGYPVPQVLGVAEPRYAEGVISAMSGPMGEETYMQVQVPVQPGNSGGPLVTESGQAVGVIIASMDERAFLKRTGTLPQNINFAVKADLALVMLDPSRVKPVRSRTLSQAQTRARRAVCQVIARTRGSATETGSAIARAMWPRP